MIVASCASSGVELMKAVICDGRRVPEADVETVAEVCDEGSVPDCSRLSALGLSVGEGE